MTIHVVLDASDQGPEIYVKMDAKTQENDPRFAKLAAVIHSGPTCLGHSTHFIPNNVIHVHKIRTHWVGDEGGYSKYGNGDKSFEAKIKGGYEVESYRNEWDESQKKWVIKARIKEEGKNTAGTDEIRVNKQDIHAPVIDGIYAVLKLARGFFPEADIKFATTESGAACLEMYAIQDPATATEDAGVDIEPTYAYISKLSQALEHLKQSQSAEERKQKEPETISLPHEEQDLMKGPQTKIEDKKITVYDGTRLFNELTEAYVNKTRKEIWDTCKLAQACFVSYYTPLEQVIGECEKQIEGIKKKESKEISSTDSKSPMASPASTIAPPSMSSPVSSQATAQLPSPSPSIAPGTKTTQSPSSASTRETPLSPKGPAPASQKTGVLAAVKSFFAFIFSPFVRFWNWLRS